MSKITEEKKKIVKRMILQGYKNKEILEQAQISLTSLKSIKKNLDDIKLYDYDYSTIVTRKEQLYISTLNERRNLYEDDIEGWTFHLSAEQLKVQKGSLWWSFIAYPESVCDDWLEKLRALHLEFAISPLHDKDVWEHDSKAFTDESGNKFEKGELYKKGSPKKSHYHGLIKFDKSISFEDVNNLIRPITNGPYLMKCYSLKGSFDYFCHLNQPNKHQYDVKDVRRFNDFVVEPNAQEKKILLQELTDYVLANRGIDQLSVLVQDFSTEPEYLNIISVKTFYFKELLYCNYKFNHPESNIKNVRLVYDEIKK